jgi:hypothetical protein
VIYRFCFEDSYIRGKKNANSEIVGENLTAAKRRLKMTPLK